MKDETKDFCASAGSISRRHLLAGMAGVPVLGSAIQQSDKTRTGEAADLKKRLPQAQIGKVKISRMILGGNPMGGWAHSRDLPYVSKLTTAYHTRSKIFETLALAESCGMNTFLTAPSLIGSITDYWRNGGGKIQFISDCGGGDLLRMVQRSIDSGAAACYVHGGVADRLVRQGDFDQISKALELIRKNGLPAGIGGHKLETVKGCVAKGLHPDFWMKTLHTHNYWSAKLQPQNDNMWCENPEETIAFMKALKEPWIAYKVLAAGAIAPNDGFKHAFDNGADFICVGMFDWQIAENVKTAVAVLAAVANRDRAWYA